MDRKEFFKRAARKQEKPFAGLTPYSGPWTANEVAHLLKRTMFGAKKQDIDHFLAMSPGAAVDELLAAAPFPATPIRDYGLIDDGQGHMVDDLGVAQGQTWVNDPNKASAVEVRGIINNNRMSSLRKWWAGLIINQQRSIMEKLVLFWHHHFSVQEGEVENAQYLWKHHQLLRTHALGNVKTVTRQVCTDPAMLMHLNGYLNSKQAPDENFARELQELFTIGKGSGSQYTEDDVIAAARVMTGWRIDDETLDSYLAVGAHDTAAKQFSAFYGNTTISGSSTPGQEVDALMDMIFNTTESARYFCRKLYKWFVYYQIDDTVEAEVITPLAAALQSNGFEILPVLELLFKSEHFFDTVNQGCYIKSPFDIIVGTLREFNVSYPAYTDYTTGYPLFLNIYQQAASMQQQLFQPPDVSGWPSYYQEPMHYELWVNSNSLPRRADFTNRLVDDAVLDLRGFVAYSSNPADPDQLVTDISTLLLRYPLSANSKQYIKTHFLLNNTTDNTVWTNAWNSNNNAVIDPALKQLFRFMMNLPEFHLC